MTTALKTYRDRKADEREALIENLVSQIDVFAHGYCKVPSISGDEPHIVHVNHNYVPDFCTCDNHKKYGGTKCAHKIAVKRYFALRVLQLSYRSEPVYYYHDGNAGLRGVSGLQAARLDQLSQHEQKEIRGFAYGACTHIVHLDDEGLLCGACRDSHA